MKATLETIITTAGKTTRFGGFAAGVTLLIDGAKAAPTNWGAIIAGTIVCTLCLIWSAMHDKKISTK